MATIHNLLGMSMERAYDKTQCSDDIKPGDFLLVEDGIAMMDGAYPVMISGVSGVFHEYHLENPEGRAARAAALAQYKALEAAEAGEAPAPALVPDYSIIVADATGRRLELFINGDCIREYLIDGFTLEDARKHVEGNKLQNAQAEGLIGADARLIERDGVAVHALILSTTQAEEVYSAMCHLNNVYGKLDVGLNTHGSGFVQVRETPSGEVWIHGGHGIGAECYPDQAAFAAAYGLEA